MSKLGGAAGQNGHSSSLQLPEQLQAALPTDPFEQLEMARRIAEAAWQARVARLEAVNSQLLDGSEGGSKALQARVVELEHALQEVSGKLSRSLDEQAKLTGEKNALVATVKKLNRDVAKLETFKRTLMQQLQEEPMEDESPSPAGRPQQQQGAPHTPLSAAETPALRDRLRSMGSALFGSGSSLKPSHRAQPSGDDSSESNFMSARNTEDDASSPASSTAGRSPLIVPGGRSTPGPSDPGEVHSLPPTSAGFLRSTSTPASMDSHSSGTTYGDLSMEGPRMLRTRTPQRTPSMTPLLSPHITPSATPPHGSAQGSPKGRSHRVDGKEFFRQARNRLSYEQFSAFLSNIKELNAHRQTREETLRKAEEIFGPDNKDLFTAFDGLLSRHLPT